MFYIWSLFLSNLVSAALLSCIPMISQACKVRSEIINLNSNEPVFYPRSIKTCKGGGGCNNINDQYSNLCIPDAVKNLNVKIFNLISRTNQVRHMKWHGTCKCKCKLDASVSNNKQRWNDDKCRCECKELIDKGVCDKRYASIPSNCECKCDKLCDIGEYLDYEKCKCKERLVNKLVKDCSENYLK